MKRSCEKNGFFSLCKDEKSTQLSNGERHFSKRTKNERQKKIHNHKTSSLQRPANKSSENNFLKIVFIFQSASYLQAVTSWHSSSSQSWNILLRKKILSKKTEYKAPQKGKEDEVPFSYTLNKSSGRIKIRRKNKNQTFTTLL